MKVLALGAGGAATNGFCRALRLAGGYQLVGTNSNETDLLLSECDDNHVIAPASDWDEWRITLCQVIAKTQPDFVHAQNDAEVRNLGRLRTIIHMYGTKTYLPSSKTIDVCQDKWASYQLWRAAGVPVPETRLCTSKDAVSSIIGLGKHAKAWLRPRTGAGGQRSFVAESYKDAVWWLDNAKGWDDFTIAECLSPDSVTVQQLYWKGQLVCSQQRTRESWAGGAATQTGVSGSTGVGVTSSDPFADHAADLAVAAVDSQPHGLYGVDMTLDRNGFPAVTEINIGRFFTTAPEFFAMAGFNMADFFVFVGTGYAPHQGQWGMRNMLPDGKRWVRGMDKFPVLA